MIKIALLDDHAILREGIKHLLNKETDLNVCCECERPSQLQPLLDQFPAHTLITDLNMPEGGGFPLLERIRLAYPEMKIIVLSMHDNAAMVSKALSFGANGYITKAKAADELVLAIRTVQTGNRYLSSDLIHYATQHTAQLSARERAVLKCLLQSKSPKAIASEMGITDKTLYAHRANIMLKLKARSFSELQENAIGLGLL